MLKILIFGCVLVSSSLSWAQQTHINSDTTINIFSSCIASLSLLNSMNAATSWPNDSCLMSNLTKVDGVEQGEFKPHPVNFIPYEALEELPFQTDQTPEKKVASLGCITGPSENVDFCYPSFLEDIRAGKLKLDDLKGRIPSRFDIKSKADNFEDKKVFEFHHQYFAKQDAGLTIWEGYHNSNKADSKATEVVFIPRSSVPRLKAKGDELQVSLANKESLTFDKNSGKLKSGVLKEVTKGKNTVYEYSGKGIMIQTSGIDGHAKSFMERAQRATISKDGKTCEVSYDKLWTRPNSKVSAHFKYATDEAFYQWLNSQSGCFK